MIPSYRALHASGELARRAETARKMLAACTACPRACNADRTTGEPGWCRVGAEASVASAIPHHGEEPGLSGTGGAGTIFFGGCNLRCVFCQNYQISQLRMASPASPEAIAAMMLDLERQGCHNIDLVSPTHVGPQVLEAVSIAAAKGLSIPLVWNSNGYDSVEFLRLLDGVVDVYLPDLKYGYDEQAREFSGAADYVERAQQALREMYRQVGDVVEDERGIVARGLIVRMLVLPDDLAGMYASLSFIAEELSTRVRLSIMSQYYPAWKAVGHPKIGRSITPDEYRTVLQWVDRLGFDDVQAQDIASVDICHPDFATDGVFDFDPVKPTGE